MLWLFQIYSVKKQIFCLCYCVHVYEVSETTERTYCYYFSSECDTSLGALQQCLIENESEMQHFHLSAGFNSRFSYY